MKTLVYLLPAIACLAMMLVMCGPMLFKKNTRQAAATDDNPDTTAEWKQLAELREEVALLKAKLALKEEDDSELTK